METSGLLLVSVFVWHTTVTDDAMVVEKYADHSIYLLKGDYRNIKITTPEDLVIAEAFLNGGDNR